MACIPYLSSFKCKIRNFDFLKISSKKLQYIFAQNLHPKRLQQNVLISIPKNVVSGVIG